VPYFAWVAVLSVLVVGSFSLNDLAMRHQATFLPNSDGARYFEESGLFITVVWVAPIIAQIALMQFVMMGKLAKTFLQLSAAKAREQVKQAVATETERSGMKGNNKAKKQIQAKK
jgi:uncharacterized membrane protein